MSDGGFLTANPFFDSGRWGVMDVYRGLPVFQPINAIGGNQIFEEIIDNVLYRIHIFTTVGSSQAFEVLDPGSNKKIDVLVVAGGGGGGGGNPDRGGGGAGGLVFFKDFSVSPTTYPVSVSAGVLGGNNTAPLRANNSTFSSPLFTLTAMGGGPGDGFGNGIQGGSGGGGGGGGSGAASLQPGTNPGALFDAGNPGGSGSRILNNDGSNSGAGGGGAGAPGGNGTSLNGSDRPAGNGGAGLDMSPYFGTGVGQNGFFAGGGAGTATNSSDGVGGIGGGGNPAQNGAPGTGGGGGASPSSGGAATSGGSGIVIVRYPLEVLL